MRDKAKVLLTVFTLMFALSGCSSSKTAHEEVLRLTEPLVVASVFALTEEEPEVEPEVAPIEPRIKIVSGDGMPLSAKMMAKELSGKGYKIERVDLAPYTFRKAVVFFAPGFDTSARELADVIKAKGGIKPLSWKSIYDIIIVSVNN
ncbi:LytR C-terminal domain-containing protein [Nitrospirota bacterium]